jgi:hypothetical protein
MTYALSSPVNFRSDTTLQWQPSKPSRHDVSVQVVGMSSGKTYESCMIQITST